MYAVTPQFKTAVYDVVRTATAKVNFEILDTTASFDVSNLTTSTPLSISRLPQLHNRIRTQSANLITCETDRVILDGSFSFVDPANENGEVGFISQSLSNPSAETSQFMTFTFNNLHRSAAISITFDTFNNEYATEVTVNAYRDSSLIESVSTTDNESVVCVLVGQFLNYNKIEVLISKWCKPNRRIRVVEVDFGVIESYDDDKLISLSHIEEMDVVSGTLPSPEFRFTIDNSDRRFNILNPQGFYKYLQERQRITAELAILINDSVYEYVPLGEFLLWEWTSEEGSMTATFTARTNFDLLDNYYYERLTPNSTNLKALAESIFAQCGITNYSIDSSLAGIATLAISERVTCKQLLQKILIAGCCNLYFTRNNIITIKPVNVANTTVDDVDFENVYAEPKIELEKVVKQVDVLYYPTLQNSLIASATATNIEIGDTLKVEKNTLINTAQRATIVANWILSQKQLRAKQTVNWRGNPALELADTLTIENSYDTVAKALVTKNELIYQGYLQGRIEAKGGVL